jgi:hypothetical protein
MTPLLLSSLFKGHKKPTVVRRHYEVLFGTSVQSTAITPHGGLNVTKFEQISITGRAEEHSALARDLRSHALNYGSGNSRILLDR